MNQVLFISNVGGIEVIVILLFVLMFFGSKRIPGLARTLGKGIREIQHASDEIKREIQSTGNDIKKDLQLGDQVNQIVQDIEKKPQQMLDQIEVQIEQTKQSLEQHAKIDQPTETSPELDKPQAPPQS